MAYATVHETLTEAFGSASTAHAVDMPASVSTGNLLLLVFTSRTGTHTTPSGWTSIANGAPGGSGSINFSVFGKDADGTEGGTTVDVVTSASAPGAAIVHHIYGWNGTLADDIDISLVLTSPSTSAPDLGAVTAGWGGSEDNLYICAYGCADDDATYSAIPTNYGNQEEIVSGGGSNAGATTMTCRRELAADSDNPGAATISATQQSAGVAIVIRPGSSGSAPGGEVTGSGAPASDAATASGAAERELPGSGTPASQVATTAGTAERVLSCSGELISAASAVAGTATLQVKLLLTSAVGRELRDETGAVVASLAGIIYEWYDKDTDTEGDPDVSGTFATNGSGEATVQLAGSSLVAGQYGLLVLTHPSDNTIRGVYRIPVT